VTEGFSLLKSGFLGIHETNNFPIFHMRQVKTKNGLLFLKLAENKGFTNDDNIDSNDDIASRN
jgi:hypothetical protein